jgi:hypothetical protein
MKLVWTVCSFDETTDEQIAAHELPDVELRAMQELFGRPADDPMYLVYQIEERHLATFSELLGFDLGASAGEHFVYHERAD